jgi:transposase
VVHAASVQDRDGAAFVLTKAVRRRFPFITTIFADAGYQGPRVRQTARRSGHWHIEIIKRSDRTGFVVEAKRWIVERTLAWISRNRRLARDFENLATTAKALIYLAMIKLMPATPRQTMTFLDGLLVLLSQKVADDGRSDSGKGRDSEISGWRLIWISERQTTVNRGFRLMSRGL